MQNGSGISAPLLERNDFLWSQKGDTVNEFQKLMNDPVNRRAFLTRMSYAGLGTAATMLLAGCGSGNGSLPNANPTPTPTPGTTVFDPVNFPGIPGRSIDETVLNYALTLEILEADLYRQALNLAAGLSNGAGLKSGLPSGVTGLNGYTQAISSGGLSTSKAAAAFLYLVQYAYVEAAHRDFLRAALSSLGAPLAQPNPRGYTAPFGSTLESIMNLIYTVEETGVRAYLGAAGFMTTSNNALLLTTAVAIHSTEARHSGAVGYILSKPAGPTFSGADKNPLNGQNTKNPAPYSENTFQYYLDPPTVLNAVKPFIVP